jgi:hypothetical protein
MLKLSALPRQVGESLVNRIARWKFDLLAYAAVAGSVLALLALGFWIEGRGKDVSSVVGEVEGYVAIAGLVLGLPALAYAMVTDSAVGRIEGQMGRDRRKEIETRIESRLRGFEEDLPDHTVQVFLPDLQRTRVPRLRSGRRRTGRGLVD